MMLSCPQNDIRLQFWHGQDAVQLEGDGVHGQILDEAAKAKEDVYASMKTTQTFTGGWFAGITTPFGKNWFWKKWAAAKERMEADIKAGRPLEVMAITAPTWANPLVPRSAIQEARRSLPKRLFDQYYGAQFIDDGNIFVGLRESLYTSEIDIVEGYTQRWKVPDCKDRTVVVGVDWAKSDDWTVFIAWDFSGPRAKIVAVCRFQQVKYQRAVGRLFKFCQQFKEVVLIRHDKTGIGQVIDDLMGDLPYAYEGIVFTNQRKAEMVNQYSAAMEAGELAIPNWKALLNEHDIYEVSINKLGLMTYGAPSGLHDDIVTACYLGYSACQEYRANNNFLITYADEPPLDELGAGWYADFEDTENWGD